MSNPVLVKGKDLHGNERTLEKTEPYQLGLFQNFLLEKEQYSNSIELYDAIPRFIASTKKMSEMRESGKYLATLRREFKFRNFSYKVEIRPGRVTKEDGTDIEYYPSEREQIIEEALWKIAHEKHKGYYLDKMIGVEFTLSELRQELYKRGHAMRYDAIIDALVICNGCNIGLQNDTGTVIFKSPIFPVLLISSRESWLREPNKARCYVQFNSLATESLKRLTYRLFNYEKFMSIKLILSRWLYKRISHNYIQAKQTNVYTIKASTIIRDSGLIGSKSFRMKVRAIDEALEELKGKHIISFVKKNKIFSKENSRKIEDICYELTPSYNLVQDIIQGNKHLLTLEGIAEKDGKMKLNKKTLERFVETT